jgi:membrane-associated phospholipid phosphatase
VLYLAFAALFLILWGILDAALPILRRGGAMLARRLVRLAASSLRIGRWHGYATRRISPYRMYLPIVLLLIGAAFVTAWMGDQFLDLAELVHAKSTVLQQADARIHDWAVSRRTPGATHFFIAMTIIGGPAGLAAIVLMATIALAIRGRWRWIAYLLVTCGGGALLNLELKRYFARARPDVAEMLRLAHGYSFPSGHAMGSTVTFGALAYLAFRMARMWRMKAACLALAITLIVSVALSRVYLGAHWISDVGAGAAAGSVWVAATTVAYETWRRIRLLRAARVVETRSAG